MSGAAPSRRLLVSVFPDCAGAQPCTNELAPEADWGRTQVPRIVDWYMAGKIEIDPMITHTIPLEDINKAFDLMHKGESIRGVVTF